MKKITGVAGFAFWAVTVVLFPLHETARHRNAGAATPQQSGAKDDAKSSTAGQGKPAGVKLIPGIMAEGIIHGQHVGMDTYGASDGVGVTVIYTDLKDSVAATEFMHLMLNDACEVISKSDKLGKDGKAVGDRYELRITSKDQDCAKGYFAIAWTDGVKFHQIESRSRTDALALEKVYRY